MSSKYVAELEHRPNKSRVDGRWIVRIYRDEVPASSYRHDAQEWWGYNWFKWWALWRMQHHVKRLKRQDAKEARVGGTKVYEF